MAITIRDVALAAGVSTATVSRALRGLRNVDPATREHVREVAERLDYVISPAASRLASGRTGSVAVLTPSISRWYFATALAGVETVMQAAGLDLLLHTVGDPTMSGESLVERRLRRRVDGVLVLGLPAADPAMIGRLQKRIPVMLIGSRHPGVPSVSIDDVAGARLATQHLVNLGHSRIGLIGGALRANPLRPEVARLTGYLDVVERSGLTRDVSLRAPDRSRPKGVRRP